MVCFERKILTFNNFQWGTMGHNLPCTVCFLSSLCNNTNTTRLLRLAQISKLFLFQIKVQFLHLQYKCAVIEQMENRSLSGQGSVSEFATVRNTTNLRGLANSKADPFSDKGSVFEFALQVPPSCRGLAHEKQILFLGKGQFQNLQLLETPQTYGD